MKKLTALLLCLALLLSLVGCVTQPAVTEPSTEPAPTEPAAQELWAQARLALEEAQNLSLEITATTVLTVAQEQFTEEQTQTLTYQGLGTEALAVDSRGELTVESPTTYQSDTMPFREIYTQGTLYLALEDTASYTTAMEQEEALSRFLPAVLLDESLYGSITAETTEQGTTLTFAGATAGETWALPEEAEFTEATGCVELDAGGAIVSMTYSAAYGYGPAEYTLTVTSKPLDQAAAVAAPENADDYLAVTHPDALLMFFRATFMQENATTLTTSSLSSTMSYAAGFLYNESNQVNLHGYGKNTNAKMEAGAFFMDYSTGEEQEWDLEETYIGGDLTTIEDQGEPDTISEVDWKLIRAHAVTEAGAYAVPIQYWADAVITDLGSLYLVELTLNEEFGNATKDQAGKALFAQPDILDTISTAYRNGELTAYFSVDKYTGMPLAGGYFYQGFHTIDGQEYELTRQLDESVELPSLGAYKEITDELLPETEPENKATPLFYHVTGENGQEMWLLGTIHVGDVRTGFLPAEIRSAFEASDALALECDTEAFDAQLEEDDALSEEVSDLYFYSGGLTLEGLIDDEEFYQAALQHAKATGSYNMNMPYAKPYVWSSGIEDCYLRQGLGLHRDKGVERRLYAWAEELGKPIREVESSMFQIKMLTGFSYELQELMLQDSISYHGRDYWESTQELYELWCAGDEAALIAELNEETDTSELTEEELAEYEAIKPLLDEYNKAMSLDRNEGMLDVAIGYLESGDVVFYAVGLAHLLDGTNGLVQALRDAGYTVELVQYK